MAKTAATGFYPRANLLGGANTQPMYDYIIANSTTIKIGDAVRVNTSGFIVRAAAGEAILGVVESIVDANGINVFSPRATGTTGTTLTPDDQVAVSSTNQSDATRNIKVQVKLDPAGQVLYYNDADGDLAATNDFQFFDSSAAGNQITASTNLDTNGQWQLIKRDPDGDGDLSKGLFRIAEGQLGGMVDSGTAKVAA